MKYSFVSHYSVCTMYTMMCGTSSEEQIKKRKAENYKYKLSESSAHFIFQFCLGQFGIILKLNVLPFIPFKS